MKVLEGFHTKRHQRINADGSCEACGKEIARRAVNAMREESARKARELRAAAHAIVIGLGGIWNF